MLHVANNVESTVRTDREMMMGFLSLYKLIKCSMASISLVVFSINVITSEAMTATLVVSFRIDSIFRDLLFATSAMLVSLKMVDEGLLGVDAVDEGIGTVDEGLLGIDAVDEGIGTVDEGLLDIDAVDEGIGTANSVDEGIDAVDEGIGTANSVDEGLLGIDIVDEGIGTANSVDEGLLGIDVVDKGIGTVDSRDKGIGTANSDDEGLLGIESIFVDNVTFFDTSGNTSRVWFVVGRVYMDENKQTTNIFKSKEK